MGYSRSLRPYEMLPSELLPRLYRIQYRGSNTYCNNSGLYAPNPYQLPIPKHLPVLLNSHIAWDHSNPSGFVALFQTRIDATKWAYQHLGRRSGAIIYTISSDLLEEYGCRVFSAGREKSTVFVSKFVPREAILDAEELEEWEVEVCATCDWEFDLFGYCRCKVCRDCTEYLSEGDEERKWKDYCANCERGGNEGLDMDWRRRILKVNGKVCETVRIVAGLATSEDEGSVTSSTLSDEGQHLNYRFAMSPENPLSSPSNSAAIERSLENAYLAVVNAEEGEILESDSEIANESADTTLTAAHVGPDQE